MAHVVMAYAIIVDTVMAYIVMAHLVMAYAIIVDTVMACVGVAYTFVAYVVTAYAVIAFVVMAYVLTAYTVMNYTGMAEVVVARVGRANVATQVDVGPRRDACLHAAVRDHDAQHPHRHALIDIRDCELVMAIAMLSSTYETVS